MTLDYGRDPGSHIAGILDEARRSLGIMVRGLTSHASTHLWYLFTLSAYILSIIYPETAFVPLIYRFHSS